MIAYSYGQLVPGLIVAVLPMWVKLTRSRTGRESLTNVQLVERYWDRGRPRHQVVSSLGRADEPDPEKVARPVQSLARLTDRVVVVSGPEDVESRGGKIYGSTYLLEQLWRRLDVDRLWREAAGSRKFRFDLEAAVRTLVLSRLRNPASERQTLNWPARAHVTGAEELTLHQLYRGTCSITFGQKWSQSYCQLWARWSCRTLAYACLIPPA
ncbi:MAG: hypothetical protein AB1445_13435 [Bacillota bacterium]